MCRIEGQKAMKYVLFCCKCMHICEMLFLACTEHISTTLPVNETQDYVMTISIKTKVLIKFGTSEMMCEELNAKKL